MHGNATAVLTGRCAELIRPQCVTVQVVLADKGIVTSDPGLTGKFTIGIPGDIHPGSVPCDPLEDFAFRCAELAYPYAIPVMIHLA